MKRRMVSVGLAVVLGWVCVGVGQNFVNNGGVVGGVGITAEGLLSRRQVGEVAGKDARAEQGLVYVSLPRVLGEWRAAKEAGRAVSGEVKYLKGMTQVRAIFVYPDQHDVVIAGPSEGLREENGLEAVGKASGRPAVQLEDLIVAMRAVAAGTKAGRRVGDWHQGGDFYGCSLEPPVNAAAGDAVLKEFGNGPRDRLVAELKKVLGPQQVRLYGVPEDSRVALVMVAADYRLKRMCMGLEPTVPAGVGNAIGTEKSMSRIWFEPSYEPVLMAADGNGYELRGGRLKVMVGAQLFQEGEAGSAQLRFSKAVTARMPEVAVRIDAVAGLQNVMDCFMVAAILQKDGVARRAGVDWAWVMDAGKYKVESVPVPRTAETIVHINGNTLATGGVAMSYRRMAGTEFAKTGPLTVAGAVPGEGWYVGAKAK